MGLDVLLRRVVEGLRRGDARRRGGERQLARAGRQRPGAVIGVGARQLVADIHVGELVLDRLERGDGAAEGIARSAHSPWPSRGRHRRRRPARTPSGSRRGRARGSWSLQPSPTLPSASALAFSKMISAWPREGSSVVARRALHAGALEIDERQLQAALARFVGRARQHDGIVRDPCRRRPRSSCRRACRP